MRELVLGAMPEGALPGTHIPSGPWCFSDREDMFPGWDGACGPGLEFTLLPDPFPYETAKNAPDSIDAAAAAANGEVLRLISLFGEKLNTRYSVTRSDAFWTMALGPWLLLATHMLLERQKRVLDMVERLGKERLLLRVLPEDCAFAFSTLQEFMLYGVQDRAFNHYVFSRILEAVAPPCWTLQALPPVSLYCNPEQARHPLAPFHPRRVLGKGRKIVQESLRQLPFPRQKGFGLGKSLLFSLAVMGSGKKADRAIPFAAYAGTPCSWVFDAEKLLFSTMPTAISSRPSLPAVPKAQGRLKGMTAAVSQDDAYRLRLAAWLEGGGRLFSVQHGANYGHLRVMGGTVFEYMQHAFVTWGWNRHEGYPLNAAPLAQPGLTGPEERKKRVRANLPMRQNAPLVLVGTEMSPYSYRLKSRPLAAAQVAYRKNKIRFLKALPDSILANTLYRPYFPVRSGLADATYVQDCIPGLSLCAGDLTKQLLACRLAVLDHYGTTLLTSLAADIPFLCYWDRSQWAMAAEAKRAVALLEKAGIWHPGPHEAAAAAARIWDDVEAWWSSPGVREAKNVWVRNYARSQHGIPGLLTWMKALYRL